MENIERRAEEGPEVRWEAPDIVQYELGEITRTAERFAESPEQATAIALVMYERFADGVPEELPEELWRDLENTESYTLTPGEVEGAREIAERNERDFDGYLRAMNEGEPIPAPMIAVYDGVPHKVAGNTRLMAARVLGITPRAMIARVDSESLPEDIPVLEAGVFEDAIAFYERGRDEFSTREEAEELIEQLEKDGLPEERIRRYRTFVETYFGFEEPPGREEFIRAVAEQHPEEPQTEQS